MSEERDVFILSNGNLEVLSIIPKMMNNKKFRNKLRSLTLDFILIESERGKKR